MSDKKRVCEPIGIATTVGQLRDMLKDLPDDMGFGFLNQPMQELYRYEDGGISAVVFQPVEDLLDGISNRNAVSSCEVERSSEIIYKTLEEVKKTLDHQNKTGAIVSMPSDFKLNNNENCKKG